MNYSNSNNNDIDTNNDNNNDNNNVIGCCIIDVNRIEFRGVHILI